MTRIAPGPQGSRTTLITSLVVFVILFVTSAIFAIYYYTQLTAETLHHSADMKKVEPYFSQRDFGNADIEALRQAAHAPQNAIQLALEQRAAESRLITGNPAVSGQPLADDVKRSLDEINAQIKAAGVPTPLPGDNLLGSLRSLAGQVSAMAQNEAKMQADLKAANDKVMQVTNERQALLADKDKQIAAAVAEAGAAKNELAARDVSLTTNTKQIQESATLAQTAAQAQATAASAEVTKLQGQLKALQQQLTSAIQRLKNFRLNPTKALQQPDGVITRVPGNNTVFINLGQGMEVSPGLTFEVYDKHRGLPPLTTPNGDETELPAGKASIEVIRVLPAGSECRIIKTATSQTIVEGDIILNLVYNPHTKFDFVVYGDFDLAQTGQATSADADVVRRLISQWGGKVSDQVTVDTDFIVLGKEPLVPNLPESPSPLDTERREKAQKALDAYLDIRSKAIQFSVPILNQNRFLYFVGYYDQAQR